MTENKLLPQNYRCLLQIVMPLNFEPITHHYEITPEFSRDELNLIQFAKFMKAGRGLLIYSKFYNCDPIFFVKDLSLAQQVNQI